MLTMNFVRVVWHNPVSQFILIVAIAHEGIPFMTADIPSIAYEGIPFMTADIPSIVDDLNAQPWACFEAAWGLFWSGILLILAALDKTGEEFVASRRFTGSKHGFVFKMGEPG